MARPAPDRRAGFTLIELLIAMVISGLLISIVFQLMQGQARYVGIQSSREEVQQNARAAIELIGSELRSTPPELGLTGAWADSVRVRVPRVWGMVCAVSGSDVAVRLPALEVSYDVNASTGFAARVGTAGAPWTVAVPVTAVGAPDDAPCGPAGAGAEVRSFTLASQARTAANDPVAVGHTAYLFDEVTYRTGEPAGTEGRWIQRRVGDSGNQPLAGPVLDGADPADKGLRFRYFAGTTEVMAPVSTAQLPTVTSVELVVRATSRHVGTVGAQVEQDTVLVSLRNRS